MPLPMSRRIELLRTKWFNLIIHSSRQMERLPIVNERIGLAWNGEQALKAMKFFSRFCKEGIAGTGVFGES